MIKLTWNGTFMITGDSNIDLLTSTKIQQRYIEVLETYDLKKLIDHIVSDIATNKILHSNVLPCPTISDHDTPYIIANMSVNKFETRYKYKRNLKNFELKKCVQVFKVLPIFLVYSLDTPNDQ